ncbi:MAG: cation-transporting P-type ATPase [Gammaproteobacteria bacterium]|nr:MAG: cation-transporting P-type ATPase [Gammaproteobacteria bacterium]
MIFDDVPISGLLILIALFVLAIAGIIFVRLKSRLTDNSATGPSSAKTAESWYALDSAEVMTRLRTSHEGLGEEEVKRSLAKYGPNRLPEPKKRGPLLRFLVQFHNLLIYVLLVASGVTAMLGHWVDTGVILGVVVVNALIGFVQEGKAENALREIRRMLSPQAMVLRAGRRGTLPAEELVPGDMVLLHSGDKVPADLRLIKSKDLQVQEAVLTGESVAVVKQTGAVAHDAVLGDRRSIAYSGTLVTYGQGTGVVVATGVNTEIGRISAMLEHVETLTTPLLRQMGQFARWLTGAIIAIAAATFAFGVLSRGYSATEMFLAAVGLAVAAIPEGLPAIMTITLAIGVQRMARRNAIIRRLPAVETLGSVTVICSDKTGTLTRNEMTVKSVATTTGLFDVDGVGYDPHGGFQLDGTEIEVIDYPILSELTRAALLCNDAALQEKEGEWVLHGDPTEGALLTLGLKAGLDQFFEQEAWPRTDVIPFESEHRFMATLHHDRAGHSFAYIKGAPERLFEMCTRQRFGGEDVPLDIDYWLHKMHTMASRGQRVLAIASKPAEELRSELTFADLETGSTLLGIVGIIDPPREDAIRAVDRCQSAGIRVKMITGDHAVTAVAIGTQMVIGDGETVLAGHEIEAMDDEQLRAAVDGVDIFARSSPEHKLRLVRALQANGHVVAMTGDGVNDAPALKRADVGVAMGQQGTEVAKEAAEMVLADDNFASIANAVEEGRTVYDNLKKAILFILPTNGGEALTIIGAIALGRALPITPVQILWVNMITAVTLALALAFEPSEKGVMQRPPRNPREALLTPMFVWRILFVSLILVAGTFGLFLWERNQGSDIELARTVAVNTLVMFEIFYLFNSRYILDPVLNRAGLLGNRYALMAVGLLLIFQLCFTYLGSMQTLFGTAAIDAPTWGRIVLVASSVLILVELEKYLVQFVHDRRK